MKRILALLLTLSLLCAPALGDETSDMLEKADAFILADDFDSARICLDIAQKLSPNDPVIHRTLARLYSAEGDFTLALTCIEDALSFAPADGTLYLEKARLLYIMNRTGEAEKSLRYAEICDAQPDDALHLEAAQAYDRAGQYEKIIELCQAQTNDVLRLQAALACNHTEQYERAAELFDTLPEAIWQNGCASAYARALIRSGNSERALALGLIASKKDETLAAAIAEGKTFRLVPSHEALLDSLGDLPVFVSNAFAEENRKSAEEAGVSLFPTDDQRVRLSQTLSTIMDSNIDLQILSASPSGNALLVSIDGLPAVVRNQEITALTINRSRGAQNEHAEDTYGYIENLSRLNEPDAFCWSPDERYITMTFPMRALQNIRYVDLTLADTRTGEIFLAEATPKKMRLDDALTATTACFDETGKYVYYLVYGKLPDDARCGLKRYCLETGEVELLCAVQDTFFYWPRLSVDKDGAVRAITDANRSDVHTGVITFRSVGGEWKTELRSFPNPRPLQAPRRYYRSENSGYELFLSNGSYASEDYTAYNITYLTSYNEFLGTGSDANAVRLPADGSGQAETMEILEYLTAIAQHTLEQPSIAQVALSPDGYSALILATHKNSVICCVLDLDTLICRRVEFPESFQPDISSIYPSFATLSWLEDDTILIPSYNTSLLFRLTIE